MAPLRQKEARRDGPTLKGQTSGLKLEISQLDFVLAFAWASWLDCTCKCPLVSSSGGIYLISVQIYCHDACLIFFSLSDYPKFPTSLDHNTNVYSTFHYDDSMLVAVVCSCTVEMIPMDSRRCLREVCSGRSSLYASSSLTTLTIASHFCTWTFSVDVHFH